MLKDLVEMPMHLADRRFQHAAMAVLLELPWILAAGGVGVGLCGYPASCIYVQMFSNPARYASSYE